MQFKLLEIIYVIVVFFDHRLAIYFLSVKPSNPKPHVCSWQCHICYNPYAQKVGNGNEAFHMLRGVTVLTNARNRKERFFLFNPHKHRPNNQPELTMLEV